MKTDEILLDFLHSHNEKEIEKGFLIFEENPHRFFTTSRTKAAFTIQVPSQNGDGSYFVNLKTRGATVQDKCTCQAFDKYTTCKHSVAAALHLLEQEFGYDIQMLQEDMFHEAFEEDLNLREEKNTALHETAKKKATDEATPKSAIPVSTDWKLFRHRGNLAVHHLSPYAGYPSTTYNNLNKLSLVSFDAKAVHWIFSYNGKKQIFYTPEIRYDAKETYYYRCNCSSRSRYPMCEHVLSAFEKLLLCDNHVFIKHRDWTEEKNNLLQFYGLTMEDEEAKFFRFDITYSGKLELRAPASFIKQGDKDALKRLNLLFRKKDQASPIIHRPASPDNTFIDFETGFVINANSQRIKLGFELEPVKVYQRQQKTDLKKLSINQPQNLPLLKKLDDEHYYLLMQLSDTELLEYLHKEGYGFLKNYSNPWLQMSDACMAVLKKHYVAMLQKMWVGIAENAHMYLLKEGKFSSRNCEPVSISKEMVDISFVVEAGERFFTISLMPVIGGNSVTTAQTVSVLHNFLFQINNTVHILKNIDDLPVMEQFCHGYIKLPAGEKLDILQNIIAPLQQRYTVHLPQELQVNTLEISPQCQVLIKEYNNEYLMLQAQFVYEDRQVDYTPEAEDIMETLPNDSLRIISRNTVLEKQFHESLRRLHPAFEKQRQNDFFYLHFNEVMKGNWFLNTVRYLQDTNVTVIGMQDLKRFRYNTHYPNWEMQAGSSIDWFDLKVKVSFGDQEVSLKEVRKALVSKQNIVILGDGTFGVLPEEWLKQYGLLLKMSDEQKDGSLKLSKLHFTLIDALHNQINDDEVLQEIEAKKQKLKHIDSLSTAAVSKKIKAKLRPYQISGFQWMQTLDDLGWGGCLADDMGLGKTLQTITFLQYINEKYRGSTHLVVCPTSLIYNWENELKKFAPGLKYHIYYGTGREFTDEHFANYDLIITSYGLVRNDMEQLLRFQWHYVILDESQAIKNPDAQTTKAVQLLKSKNRLILSGTPVQNNTYDLFAQFHFVNAGLLGNKEFFKAEFANPIDKYNDADKSNQLRKLIYPFLLRRTKEQVAKDLPDKTETILWCQMPREQRSVYEDYKQYYRSMLLRKIEEEGMAKAGIYVLEGLLRLRQICNSPQLLKDAEVSTTQSIKTEELLREIEENTGEHKLLVFSQFTEMLHLIERELQQKNICYCYLDGSTSARKRKEQVETFQSDDKAKVFLVSLKAGGVGLNLTAADYVYLIDPWWNPAIEQQAIDRTHRIGQTKKIFAYKMICKDTVEERILELQHRKKQLANELVTEDAGFIKKLTREDVAFLFS